MAARSRHRDRSRRSFAVLEALSHRRTSTLAVLTGETGLPRPTVVRLLHTLIALGYAARVSREQGYRLTDRVLGLSESIRFVDHLVDAAMPHMRRFTEEHGWPLYLATPQPGRDHRSAIRPRRRARWRSRAPASTPAGRC